MSLRSRWRHIKDKKIHIFGWKCLIPVLIIIIVCSWGFLDKANYTINASQCLWGTWKITQSWFGGLGFQECKVEDEKKNMEITFLPRQCCFGDTAVQIDHYASRLIAVSDESRYNYGESSRSLGMKGNYALEVWAYDTEKEIFLPFTHVVLISDREMIVFDGRLMHKAIKIEDQEVEEDIGFDVWEIGDVCNGKWKIAEEISLKRDSEIHVGDIVEVRVWCGLRETGDVPYCRAFSLNDNGVKELARSFAISDNSSLMVCYEFAEDFGWDKMIVKDTMNVILVKGDAYYLAKRISDAEEDGIYDVSF